MVVSLYEWTSLQGWQRGLMNTEGNKRMRGQTEEKEKSLSAFTACMTNLS